MDSADSAAARRERVPQGLIDAAAWCWRLIVIGAFLYFLGKFALRLKLVVVPLLTALLLTALLAPIASRLKRWGAPRGVAALVTMLIAIAVIGGIGAFVWNRAAVGYPQLVDQIAHLVSRAQHWLETGPLNLQHNSVSNIGDKFVQFLRDRQGEIAASAVHATRTVAELLTGLVLTIFLTILMVYDGDRMWAWITGLFPTSHRARAHAAGEEVWKTLSGYVTGTFTVAVFHGVVMGITLWIVGVPLVAPLAVLIFVGSFVPLIGIVVFGGLAVLVTLVSNNATDAVIVLVVLVVEHQIEAHALQPFIVGRYVRLHPLVIAVTLTAGAVLAGLPGAIFAVPLVASINAAMRTWLATARTPQPAAPASPD
jgi:predicted PurR-regulated permease PerM